MDNRKGSDIIAKNKWNRAHEFKEKKSTRRAVGHPVYIYGKRGRNYKYLTFTHKPETGKEADYERLNHNINPKEFGKDTYVKKKYGISVSSSFDPPDHKYRIHEDDLPIIKRYKK